MLVTQTLKQLVSMLRSPARPVGRSWKAELLMRTMSSLFQRARSEPISWFRAVVDKEGLPHTAKRKVSSLERDIGGVPCIMLQPKSLDEFDTVIVYFHGGGYVVGSPASHASITAQLAVNSDCLVIVPDYRLAPEHPFPAPQDDCLTVTRAVMRTYADKRIVLAGDSAGGGLALCMAHDLSLAEEDMPDALVLLSPWVDPSSQSGSMRSHADLDYLDPDFAAESFAHLMQDKDPCSPRVNFAKSSLAHLPPSLVQYGDSEIFTDQIRQFCERANTQGVQITEQCYQGQFHVFHLTAGLVAEADKAMHDIADFIRSL